MRIRKELKSFNDMKKLLICIVIAFVGFAMVSCDSAEKRQHKAVLARMTSKEKKGWQFIEKNLTDAEKKRIFLQDYREIVDEEDAKNSPLKNYEGISIVLYYITDTEWEFKENENFLAVCFKYGEPKIFFESDTFLNNGVGVQLMLIDAWDERSATEKALERENIRRGLQWMKEDNIKRRRF